MEVVRTDGRYWMCNVLSYGESVLVRDVLRPRGHLGFNWSLS